MTLEGSSPRLRHILALAGFFGLLYGLTADWSLAANADAVAAALPAWSLAVTVVIGAGTSTWQYSANAL